MVMIGGPAGATRAWAARFWAKGEVSKLLFNRNEYPTLGVEVEVGLVSGQSMALTSGIARLVDALPQQYSASIKPELMQCYVEVNTAVCRTVAEADADLREKFRVLQVAADRQDIRLLWSGTHPFSLWRDQEVTPTARYEALVDLLQDLARQLITFGLHVHVGVESGDKAVQICDRITQYLPLLLALSCNSPFWEGRASGLQSSRSKVMEGLPTAGLPAPLTSWSEYTWLITHLIDTGFINTIREIWWDVRPHHNFGTVEVRVCDVPANLDEALALTALIQCLVRMVSDEIDEGAYRRDFHPMFVRQNKWRACRFGHGARLVDGGTLESRSVAEALGHLMPRLTPLADELGCREFLDGAAAMAAGPSAAERQVRLLRQCGDQRELVERLTSASRV